MHWIRTAAIGLCMLATLSGAAAAAAGFPPDARAASAALGEVGVHYAWSGTSPASGFDSSGLVVWAFARQGIRLPHSAQALYTLRRGERVSRAALRPGDLVFFDDGGHVGIYVGHGAYVHAPHTGATVEVATLGSGAGRSFTGAVRVLPLR